MALAPVNECSIFGSAEFSDEAIISQLKSLDHQLRLADHGDWLTVRGPCTVSIAEAISGCKTKDEALTRFKKYLEAQNQLRPELVRTLIGNSEQVLCGLRIAAESYLARSGRGLPSWGEGSGQSAVPDIVLVGESGCRYKPKEYLARGSAGLVYSAERDGVPGFVLKRVYPTQLESALNEYKVASRLRGCSGCLSYVDCIRSSDKEIWLVLPLINRSEKYGVDLREYISKGFFQEQGHAVHARSIVIQLLEGLEQVSKKGIIMRDVKPDNVLVQQTPGEGIRAVWTDFGLAVDLGSKCDGENLRQVRPESPATICDDLVCWWYDTCKLVPRPKWAARRPPERGFADPGKTNGAHSFDAYMTGIIFACIALGIDLPHIDQAECRKSLETVLGGPLDAHYLTTFELGASMEKDSRAYRSAYQKTFGAAFGEALFALTTRMLAWDPAERPQPAEGLSLLRSIA